MLDVLLCGASDTAEVRDEFVRVVSDFGGAPLHYQSGDILYVNSASSTWAVNSQSTVQGSDLCVFVIVRAFGTLTWTTEFREVVTNGKPFVILCLDSVYNRYLQLRGAVRGEPATEIADDDRLLMDTLAAVERDHQVTIAPFPADGFAEVLRRQLASTYVTALGVLETQNRRGFLRTMFNEPESLAAHHLEWAIDLARDETEEKGPRKQAVRALAMRGVATEELTKDLLNSPEQGIQRLAFQLLAELYTVRPPEPDFLRSVVDVANSVDDVGVGHRMLLALFAMDISAALGALEHLALADIGLRRRLADQLEQHEERIIRLGLLEDALRLAERCRAGSDEQDWKTRLKQFIERHSEVSDGA